jgi:mono/diheme cytochrome c family protein
MRRTRALGLAVTVGALGAWLLAGVGAAQSPPAPPAPAGAPAGTGPANAAPAASSPAAGVASPAPPVEISREFLGDPQNVQRGRAVWQARCQFCHGKTAYPGKAPRLDPSRYTPEFVYDRVANGFQGMPPWRHEFSVEDLKAVVAYVLSKEFSN